MRAWIKTLVDKQHRAAAVGASRLQPFTPAAFYLTPRRRRPLAKVEFVLRLWQQACATSGFIPKERYSMGELVGIFKLPCQSLGTGLREAGWRPYKVRGGPRYWYPPPPEHVNAIETLLAESKRPPQRTRSHG